MSEFIFPILEIILGIILLFSGGEFFIPQADLDPITPSNVSVKSTTKRGSKDGIRPTATEGGTFFIQRQGKALREMLFSDVELSYVANNISLLASHLIVDPKSMAVRPATDTTEGDLLMIVNSIPFYANKNDNSKFIFNSTLFVKLHEYFFICALSMHIKAYNDMVTRPSIQEIGGEKTMDKSKTSEEKLEATKVETKKEEIKKDTPEEKK